MPFEQARTVARSGASWPLKLAVGFGFAFLHFPIAVIAVYAFNSETSAFTFPSRDSPASGSPAPWSAATCSMPSACRWRWPRSR